MLPQYGAASLADLLPALLSGLGVPGEDDRLGLGLDGVRRVCLLVVDGLGAVQFAEHPGQAPFLAGLPARTLTAGFPSTTVVSLSSIGTGLPPGEHGLVGYQLALPDRDRVLNLLRWRLHGAGPEVDMLREEVPEQWQPLPTAFERAVAAGVTVIRLAPSYQDGSGLTRASLRGGQFRATHSAGDLAASAAAALRGADRVLVYAYVSDLDVTGHVRGPASDAWALQLGHIDLLASALAARLPPDAALVVTADHGMVEVTDPLDLDAEPLLSEGVRLVGGEPRARYVYARPGAAADVLTTWQATLGAGYRVLGRDEAVAEGWFGPVVLPHVLPRIGDVVAVAEAGGALVRRSTEPVAARLLGHHGALTEAELAVPLLVARR